MRPRTSPSTPAFEPLIFAPAVEGLLRSLKPVLDASAKAKLKAAGLDPEAPVPPGVPLETWLKVITIASELVAPGTSFDEGSYRLGRRFIDGYAETLVGKALLAALRVLGPRRTLARMSRNFRSGNNFSDTTLSEPSPGDYRLWCNQVSYPHWYRGVIEAGLEAAGAREVQVELYAHDLSTKSATFRVRWG